MFGGPVCAGKPAALCPAALCPSGVVPIAHDSAGPREDIVVPEITGGGGSGDSSSGADEEGGGGGGRREGQDRRPRRGKKRGSGGGDGGARERTITGYRCVQLVLPVLACLTTQWRRALSRLVAGRRSAPAVIDEAQELRAHMTATGLPATPARCACCGRYGAGVVPRSSTPMPSSRFWAWSSWRACASRQRRGAAPRCSQTSGGRSGAGRGGAGRGGTGRGRAGWGGTVRDGAGRGGAGRGGPCALALTPYAPMT